jgi:hypothetical protein
MSEFQLAILAYVPLQLAAFVLLPKWWKLAAVPALFAVPGIFSHDGYMGEVFATLFLMIGCGYLGLVLVIAGALKLTSRWQRQPRSIDGERGA